MSKVDQDERRAQIAEGLVRVVARDGMQAVTMRSVAAEAGVSLRLVQYYFTSKAQLLAGVLRHLERQSNDRWTARIAQLPPPASARDFVEAFLDEALPTDEQSRTFHLAGTSYAVLAMTDPDLAGEPVVAGLTQLKQQLTDALDRAQADGELAPDRDPATEATHLVALNHGLGTMIMVGQHTVAEAKAVSHAHLDRLFTSQV